jgi:hypothetical protein
MNEDSQSTPPTRKHKIGDSHPSKPDIYCLGKRNGSYRWGDESEVEDELAFKSLRENKLEAKSYYTRHLSERFPLRVQWILELSKQFPDQNYGDESADWEALEGLYRERNRLNLEHPVEGYPVFSIRRILSTKSGGALSLENSTLHMGSRYIKTHSMNLGHSITLLKGKNLDSIISEQIRSVKASTELVKTLQQNHVVSTKLAELGKLLAA